MLSLPTSPPSKWNSDHTTKIIAPINIVWDSLIDIHSWNWNDWVRLYAEAPKPGVPGKTRISQEQEGKKKGRYYDFVFGKISREEFTFEWRTRFGLYSCTNSIKLMSTDSKTTTLKHTQTFQGVLPAFACLAAFHFKKLRSFPLRMNNQLKNHVESAHFNSLLFSLSCRDLSRSRSRSTQTIATECSGSSKTTASSKTNFWDSPRHIRKQLISSFIDGMVECQWDHYKPSHFFVSYRITNSYNITPHYIIICTWESSRVIYPRYVLRIVGAGLIGEKRGQDTSYRQ